MHVKRPFNVLVALSILLAGAGTTLAQTGWTVPDLDHEYIEKDWGFVRADYAPPVNGTHAIFFMEGYMGASTPANGLDYSEPAAPQPTHPTHYVRMPDGVLIGVTVHHEFSGLLGGHGVALVMASVRGTGCSGGTFNLFDTLHREDGARLIDWIPTQPGFEPEVGLFGASYSGITALLVASEQPKHLAAVSANMVIGDMYRDIAYPGGVPNIMFPGLWTLGLRPAQDYLGTAGGLMELDTICAQNVATRDAPYPTNHAGVGMYTLRTDDPQYRSRSPAEVAAKINVPIIVGQSFQDEQTGPRGGLTVWPELQAAARDDPCTPQPDTFEPRLLMTNGVHGTSTDNGLYHALPWFLYWLKGDATGYGPGTGTGFCELFEDRVRVLFEKRGSYVQPNANGPATIPGDVELGGVYATTHFPAPETDWQAWTLHGDGAFDRAAAGAQEASRSYLAGTQRVGNWNYGEGGRSHEGSELTQPAGPDLLRYRSAPLDAPLTVLGPITVKLTLATTATDTDLFVTIADVDENGDTTYLQKGLVRASHRALDPGRTWSLDDGTVIRPAHMSTTANELTPGEPTELTLGVMTLGHQFREGHQLQVQIHTPPLNEGRWGYGPVGPAAINTVYHDAASPATVLLPVIPSLDLGDAPACGVPDGYRCITASHNEGP